MPRLHWPFFSKRSETNTHKRVLVTGWISCASMFLAYYLNPATQEQFIYVLLSVPHTRQSCEAGGSCLGLYAAV